MFPTENKLKIKVKVLSQHYNTTKKKWSFVKEKN